VGFYLGPYLILWRRARAAQVYFEYDPQRRQGTLFAPPPGRARAVPRGSTALPLAPTEAAAFLAEVAKAPAATAPDVPGTAASSSGGRRTGHGHGDKASAPGSRAVSRRGPSADPVLSDMRDPSAVAAKVTYM